MHLVLNPIVANKHLLQQNKNYTGTTVLPQATMVIDKKLFRWGSNPRPQDAYSLCNSPALYQLSYGRMRRRGDMPLALQLGRGGEGYHST